MRRLHSYVVARDYGFAPNPFFGSCTLAACKNTIRKTAPCGDWVIGTGSKTSRRDGFLVYAMLIAEVITFDGYWADPRFEDKKPNLHASKKRAYGDNIYHRDPITRLWIQENSHHSFHSGRQNPRNLSNDTKCDNVLVAHNFAYWGGNGPRIPVQFRDWDGYDICVRTQGHKNRFPEALVQAFIEWLDSLGARGYLGEPLDWKCR